MSDLTDTYYAADGIFGYGTQWLIGDGASPESFQAVPFVKKITPGNMETAVYERTHLRSPQTHREKAAGLRDSGAFTIELIYQPRDESQSNVGGGSGSFASGGLFYLWRQRVEKNMKLELPDVTDGSPSTGTQLPFAGVITKCQIGEIGNDGDIPLMVEVTPLRDFSASLP